LKRQTKCMLYKTLTRLILTYGIECWPLSKKDGIMLQIFERRILRMIYGPVTIMVYGEEDIIVSFIPFTKNQTKSKWTNYED